MPVYQNYSTQTVLEAFQWLNKQPGNWMKHIKDKNTMVKMYLKSHKRENTGESTFKKELNQFLETEQEKNPENHTNEQEWGAYLVKQQKTSSSEPSHPVCVETPPPSTLISKEDISPKNTSTPNRTLPSENTLVDFLDEKSLQSLKTAQAQLNIQNEEETLRVLIQLGCQSLEKHFSY